MHKQCYANFSGPTPDAGRTHPLGQPGPHLKSVVVCPGKRLAGSTQADAGHHCCMQDMVVSVLPWSGPENGWRQPRRHVVYSLRLTIFALSVLLAVVVSASPQQLAAAWLRGILVPGYLPGPHAPAAAAWAPTLARQAPLHLVGNMCFVFCSLPKLVQRVTVVPEATPP